LQRVIDKEIKKDLAKMMLFGELRGGGWLTVSVVNNKITLAARGKVLDVPLLAIEESKENANQDN
jgi:hypothetical protein